MPYEINKVALPLERITMSVYQALTLMISFATLVVLILNFNQKK
ncbi:putative holin-like toxin [Companilactobacillus alimentarius]